MDQLQAIRAFNRVVETGSFTRAAETLQWPKATVSKLVIGLEAHLKTQLLQRTTRRVTVTAEGQTYYERTRRLVTELEDIDAAVGHARTGPRGSLRVEVGSSLARQVIIPALPDFHARYPGIRLDLGVNDRPADLIGDHVDCVLRGGELSDSSLAARRIATLPWVLCASPSYLASHGAPATLADLQAGGRHEVVHYQSTLSGRPIPLRLRDASGALSEVLAPAWVGVNESNAHIEAACCGLGLIQVPRAVVARHLAHGELVEVLPELQPPPLPVHAVYPASRYVGARLRAFIDWAAEICAGLELAGRFPDFPLREDSPPAAAADTTRNGF